MQLPPGTTYGQLLTWAHEAAQIMHSPRFHDMLHWNHARQYMNDYGLRVDSCQARITKIQKEYAQFELPAEGEKEGRIKTAKQLYEGKEAMYPVMLEGKELKDFIEACDKVLQEPVSQLTVASKNGIPVK